MGKTTRQVKSNDKFFRGKATIVGRVTSARSGKSVAGAEVRARIQIVDQSKGWPPCAKAHVKTVADEKGRYELKIPGLRKLDQAKFYTYFDLAADAARCEPEQVMPVRRPSDRPGAGKRLTVNLKLKPAFAVAGRVVDETGTPIEGVEVIVYQSSSYGCCNPMLVGGDWPKTDADGRFLADGMPPGLPTEQRQTAGFFHDDFQRRFIQRLGNLPRSRNRTADLGDIVLQKGLRLSGTVRTARGTPVVGAKVLVRADRPYEGDPGCARPPAKWGLKTDSQGRYAAVGLPPMIYTVSVTHDAHPPGAKVDVNLMTRSQSGVDVVLDKAAGILAGTVTRADGTPAANVELKAEQHTTWVERAATTNRRGRYRLEGFAAHLGVTFEGFTDMDMLAWFDPPNTKADIRLPEEITVTGRLVDGRTGQPIRRKDKRVLITTDPDWQRGIFGQLHPRSGRFEIPGVWPGVYYLCSRTIDEAFLCRKVNVTASHCDLGDVLVHGGVTLTGKVLTPSGKPIRGAEVFIDGPQYYDGESVRTDAQGRYAINKLSDGAYQFRVRAEGYAPLYEQE
ncbi:MAG: carboxypeptidase regulatory-like domain-containing protein, partial [Planctomycetota bacterium]